MLGKLLLPNIAPYVMGILAVLALAGGLTIYIQHLKLGEEGAKLDEAQAATQEVIQANGTCQATVTSLQASLKLWKDSATNAARAGSDAAAQADKDKQAIQALSTQLATKEASDNGNLTCSKFVSTDLATMCPGHAAAVRMRASNSLSGPSSK